MRFTLARGVIATLLLVVGAGCGTEKEIKKEPVFVECGPGAPNGVCEAGYTCFEGECVESATLCSLTNLEGRCAEGFTCFEGGCVPVNALCGPSNPTGPCATGNTCLQGECVATADLCSAANPDGICPSGQVCRDGICAGDVLDACDEHVYTTQPTIGVRTEVTASATGAVTLNGVAAGDRFTVGSVGSGSRPLPPEAGVVLTAVAGTPGEAEFRVGANDTETAANLASAINANPIASALVTATAEGSTVRFTAKAPGAAGNGIGISGTPGIRFNAERDTLQGGRGTGKAIITVDGLQFRDASGNGQLEPYEDWRLRPICRARDLAQRMTVPEKVGLMSESSSLGGGTADGLVPASARAQIVVNHVRQALFRFGSRTGRELAASINNMQELAEALPYGIPIVITGDPAHSIRMSTNAASGAQSLSVPAIFSAWPTPLGLGAANDAELTWLYGDTVRREFMAAGLRWQLGPMADSATEPRWERVQGTFGENALAVAKHVRACVAGFQGSYDGDLRNGIAATAKHFPGAGTNEEGMDSHSFEGRFAVHPGGNFEYHLIPFQAAFDIGVAAIMPCYSVYADVPEYNPLGVPSGFSYGFITELAKQKMGFTGMVTGDWGAASSSAFGSLQNLSTAERAAMWLEAGSHQYGSDSSDGFLLAYNEGLVTEEQINEAAAKILEMTFKLGLFENPYVDEEYAEQEVNSEQNQIDGFNAQKRAIVLLQNRGNVLPISGERQQADSNGDGVVKVYYDGVVDALYGSDRLSAFLDDYDYRSPAGDGVMAVEQADIAEADIAVLRISARKGTYFGLDAGVPLSYDKPFPGLKNDSNYPAAVRDRNRVIDAFRIRDGYTRADGTFVEPVNPNLKIVLVMNMDRPSIVKPFIHGLKTLDELPGEPGSYPMVSDENNVNQSIVTQTVEGAHAGVDAFLVDFGAYDRAILDFLFNQNVPPGVDRHGLARLPMEIPSTDAEVEAQYEDLPADTRFPTFRLGAGMSY